METHNIAKSLHDDIFFNLSYQVNHHTKALRSLSVNNNGILVTGSFDGLCSIFEKNAQNQYQLKVNTTHHKDGIYVVRSSVDSHFFFTAGKDLVINMMDCEGNLLKDFVGHQKIINSLSQAESDSFISGSWDGTALVWDIEKSVPIYQLSDHSYAVSTLALPNKKYITGSQDKKLKIWDKDKLVNTIELAHDDIIRDIILDENGNSFYTCSNDCIIKQWTMDGRLINKLAEHDGFLFTILKKNGILFSGGDEKIVKYWKGSKVLGDLLHPNTVWDLDMDPAGDLITGNLIFFIFSLACGDGAFRVFTQDSSRWMNENDLGAYSDICSQAISGGETHQQNEINPDTLIPINELETTPGKEGEIKLFNDNGKGVAYVKNGGAWNLIGEVMEVKSNKKFYPGDKLFKEGEYDYVFDVELQGNYTKIPINKDDNCLVAAEKFIARESLHRNYVDEIVRFLRENVKAQNKLTETKPKTFEKNIYSDVELDKPFQKVLEFNSIVMEDLQFSDYCLDDKRKLLFQGMIDKLRFKYQYDTLTFEDEEINLFFSNILNWPLEQLAPILDLSRIMLLVKFIDKDYSNNVYKLKIFNRVIECLEKGQTPHKILSFRILNNMFNGPRGIEFMTTKISEVLLKLEQFKNETHKGIRSAICGLFLNYSSEIYNKYLKETDDFLLLINEFLKTENEVENAKDLLFAVCNMAVDNKRNTGFIKDLNLTRNLKKFISSEFKDEKDKTFLEDIIYYFDDYQK